MDFVSKIHLIQNLFAILLRHLRRILKGTLNQEKRAFLLLCLRRERETSSIRVVLMFVYMVCDWWYSQKTFQRTHSKSVEKPNKSVCISNQVACMQTVEYGIHGVCHDQSECAYRVCVCVYWMVSNGHCMKITDFYPTKGIFFTFNAPINDFAQNCQWKNIYMNKTGKRDSPKLNK